MGNERFGAEYGNAVKGTTITLRAPMERTAIAAKRLTKAAAHKLIAALVAS